jgi:hypothetical protein
MPTRRSTACVLPRAIGGSRAWRRWLPRMVVNIRKPGGSHVVFEYPAVAEAVSVPARRPIKPVQVRRFVAFIEVVRASNE